MVTIGSSINEIPLANVKKEKAKSTDVETANDKTILAASCTPVYLTIPE
jgi:hypothetical protein